MKKLKKFLMCFSSIFFICCTLINVLAFSIDRNTDFKPKTSAEKNNAMHTSYGYWNNGGFFESVTWTVTGYDAETGKQKIRVRYYITHRGDSGSYIYQKVPVAIAVDGKKQATFKSYVGESNKIANKTQLCAEKTITLKPGIHEISLYDDKDGAITVVNVKKKFDVPEPDFTVKFYSWDGSLLKTEIVTKGDNATPPTPPNRPGYHFTGWDKPYTNITDDKDITAKYEINKYTVTWQDYNGTVLKTEIVNHGGNASPPTSPSRPGYTFTGWDSPYTNITSNRTITATYSIKYFNAVTSHWMEKDTSSGAWNPSGSLNSSGSMILHGQTDKQSLSYGSMYYPQPTSITGYELSSNSYEYNAPSGWTSKPNGTGVQVLQTISAEYYYRKKVYTVSFNSNGGTSCPSQSVKYKNKVPLPSPTKTDNKFMGWYTDSALKNKFDPNTQITGNVTLYAKWDEKPKITAEDMVIFEDIYTADQWKEELKNNATAADKEDGNITPKIKVIYDNTDLSKKGEYKVTYQVSDSVGNTVTKDIKVTVLDKTVGEEKTNKYIRSISSAYLDTLKPTSKWRLKSDLSAALHTTLAKTDIEAEETWHLTAADIERIKEFNKTHDYSPESNALFLSQFGNLKY